MILANPNSFLNKKPRFIAEAGLLWGVETS